MRQSITRLCSLFFESEIAVKISLTKISCKYTVLYRIPPELKVLQYDVKSSLFLIFPSTRLSMQTFKYTINDKSDLAETNILAHSFLEGSNAQNLFDSLYESMKDLEKIKLSQLAIDGHNVNSNALNFCMINWSLMISQKL